MEPVRTRLIVACLTVALIAAACTSSARSSGAGGTTSPSGHTTPSAVALYPPIPLPWPDSVIGCAGRKRTGLTTSQAATIISRVTVMAGNQLQMTGACPGGPVLIGLTPGNEQLAHQLLADYGRKLAVTVGLTTYDGSPGRSPRCGMLPPSASLPVGLHLVLRLKHDSVRSGAAFSATVVVDEHGPGRFTMDTGRPLVAVVVRPGTLQVVGVYSGGIAGTGYSLLVTPGKSGTIPTFGGTARCDGGLGSALPPGTYQVIVRVAPEGRHQYPAYLTPPLTLRVTA